jgi:hypothetical protein
MIARSTGRMGSMKNPPGSQNRPEGVTFSHVSGCGTATITETGSEVPDGTVDYLSLHPQERWFGGVAVNGHWRWDQGTERIVHTIVI